MRLCEDGIVSALQEEFRKKDEELLALMEWCSVLEGALRRKEEELDQSKGVET